MVHFSAFYYSAGYDIANKQEYNMTVTLIEMNSKRYYCNDWYLIAFIKVSNELFVCIEIRCNLKIFNRGTYLTTLLYIYLCSVIALIQYTLYLYA